MLILLKQVLKLQAGFKIIILYHFFEKGVQED